MLMLLLTTTFNAWALLLPNVLVILIKYRNVLPEIMIISGILSLLTSAISINTHIIFSIYHRLLTLYSYLYF